MTAQDDAALPELDFLEYLGEWENEQGEWMDPLLLEEQELAESGERVE